MAVPASAGRHPACAAAGERTRRPPAAPPPVTPTPAGKRLARHARTLLAAANAALDDVAEAARHEPTAPRPLRVGIMGHGSAELTPAAINAYRRARPDVPVKLLQLDFTEHVSALVEHHVDIAFVRPAPDDERITCDSRITEQRIIAVSQASPLADAHSTGLRIQDIASLPFFRVPRHTPHVFAEYLYFGREAHRRSTDFAVTPQEVLTHVVTGRAAGSGLKSFARYYAWPGAVFVPVLRAPWDSTHLAIRTDDTNSEVKIFRALAVDLAHAWHRS